MVHGALLGVWLHPPLPQRQERRDRYHLRALALPLRGTGGGRRDPHTGRLPGGVPGAVARAISRSLSHRRSQACGKDFVRYGENSGQISDTVSNITKERKMTETN